MVSPRVPALGPLVLACTACFIDTGTNTNTGETTAAATTTGTTSTATTADPSTGPLDPTTGIVGTTTTDDPTTTSSSSTTSSSTTTSETTGEPQPDCWAQGVTGWPIAGVTVDAIAPDDPIDPYLSPDGLGLLYIGGDARRPYVTTRQSRTDPFPAGAAINQQWPAAPPYYHPALSFGIGELLLSDSQDILLAIFNPFAQPGDDPYVLPQILGAPVNLDDFQDTHPRATEDGALLVIQRDDGPAVDFLGKTWRFHQFERQAPQIGDPFTGDVDVTPYLPPLGIALCPALSPDGLHLFFTSIVTNNFTPDEIDELDLYYTRRPDRQSPWDPPELLPSLSGGNGITCATSVTRDGCSLAFYKFTTGDPPFVDKPLLADRTPIP